MAILIEQAEATWHKTSSIFNGPGLSRMILFLRIGKDGVLGHEDRPTPKGHLWALVQEPELLMLGGNALEAQAARPDAAPP